MRRFNALLCALFVFCGSGATASLLVSAPSAAASTAYTPEPPVVDEVSGGPWNTSQGDPSQGGEYPSSDLLPTFAFGGPETTLGGVSEPNSPSTRATGCRALPERRGGDAGPARWYCGSGNNTNESGAPVSQPAGSTLPFAPYYFPDVVRNADGSLTGYFDYRPKDADEAIVGRQVDRQRQDLDPEGKALEQNPGYCPTADTNDDGEGHPYVMTSAAATPLHAAAPGRRQPRRRPARPPVNPGATEPAAGLPATEPVGVDPNTFATAHATGADDRRRHRRDHAGHDARHAGSPSTCVAGPTRTTQSAASPGEPVDHLHGHDTVRSRRR